MMKSIMRDILVTLKILNGYSQITLSRVTIKGTQDKMSKMKFVRMYSTVINFKLTSQVFSNFIDTTYSSSFLAAKNYRVDSLISTDFLAVKHVKITSNNCIMSKNNS